MTYLFSGARPVRSLKPRHRANGASTFVSRTAVLLAVLCAATFTTSCKLDELFSSSGIENPPANEPPGEEEPLPATRLEVKVQPGTVVTGISIAPALQIAAVDADGETVPTFTGSIAVTLETNPSGAALSGTLTRNAVAGVVTFTGLSIDKAGAGYKLRATSGSLTAASSATFNITAPAPPPPPPPPPAVRIALVSGNTQTDTIGGTVDQPYVVRVTDASGNPVQGFTVTWASTGESDGSVTAVAAQTNASGLASANHKLGTKTGAHAVTASASGLQGSPVTFTSTANPGKAASLAFTRQPANTDATKKITPPPIVAVHDRMGNVVTSPNVSITMSIVPLTGTLLARLSGDLNVNTANGLATFSDLKINLVGLGYRLRATAGSLTVDSSPFNITLDDN